MQKIKSFFWLCSGADISLLQKCPTESSKYVGIGATIFFTGLFAALAGAYALYTVFDHAWLAAAFGLVWGFMIFNLDRYIVCSMRKEGRFARELITATPRLLLAILISFVIAKPLELKIFEKEIQPELIVMEQQAYARQEVEVTARFLPISERAHAEIANLKREIIDKAKQRDELVRLAQAEADGTGGSKKKNLGPIYKVKKADAEKAETELDMLTNRNTERIKTLETSLEKSDSTLAGEIAVLKRTALDGPASRMEALSRLTAQSSAIWWANIFIVLLFIVVETAPVIVKLISAKGPFDNLLKIEEHKFASYEIEALAKATADIKERTSGFPEKERTFVSNRLDTELL